MKNSIIVAVHLVLLLTSCSKETAPIRLGTMPTYSDAIYAVGIEQGFFEDAGVEVELTVFRSARDRDGAATAGQLDGFMTDIMGAVNLTAKGFPVVMTSREFEEFGLMAGPQVASADQALPKVGIGENTVVEYVLDTYGSEEVEKVNIVAVPDRMGALLAGELDYGVFPQPFMGIIMGNGGSLALNTADFDFHPVTLVFDKDYLKNNERSVKAFYQAYAKTVAYMQSTDYSDYKEALVKHGLATEETVDLYRIPVSQYGLNSIKEEDYNAIIQWMTEKDLLEARPAFGDITDFKFID